MFPLFLKTSDNAIASNAKFVLAKEKPSGWTPIKANCHTDRIAASTNKQADKAINNQIRFFMSNLTIVVMNKTHWV